MLRLAIFCILGTSILFFTSCDPEIEEPEFIYDTHYFPAVLGHTWVYQMDSTIYDDQGNTVYNTTSFHRERITDAFMNENGDSTYVLEISYKRDSTSAWDPYRQWLLEKTPTHVNRVEENLIFRKLLIPVDQGQEWESPQFNTNDIFQDVAGETIYPFKNWSSKVLAVNDSFTIDDTSYTEVVKVQQADDTNIIERRFSMERYELGIGLIHRRMMILDTQCTICEDPWEEKAEAGFILVQKLIDYQF